MVEVIEIGSSPEVKQPTKSHTLRPILSSDDFNTSVFDDDDEWLSIRPLQRRRANSLNKSINNISSNSPPHSGLKKHDDLPISTSTTVIGACQATCFDLTLESAFSDEIVFTSSVPELQSSKKSTIQKSDENQAPDDLEFQDDEIFSFSQPLNTRKTLSERTANVIANIASRSTISGTTCTKSSVIPHSSITKSHISTTNSGSIGKRPLHLDEEIFDSSPAENLVRLDEGANMERGAKTAARAAEKAAVKAAKETAKQEEKEKKRIAKEQKAREKQLAADIAEVNKAKWEKKISTPEMILDLPRSFEGSSVSNQSVEFMSRLGVETTIYDSKISPGNVVRWRRKVRAEFDEEEGQWRPKPETIEHEKHVLCHLEADTFVDLVVKTGAHPNHDNLGLHVATLKTQNPDCKLIFLIEGLSAWLRKNRNNRNRAYQNAVRGQEDETQNARKRKVTPADYIDEDAIEDALLQLQINYHSLIYQTSCPSDSAEWIKNFTEHISTVPYRQERMNAQNNAAFCMDVGQVRTGDNAFDTYVRMLQEVHRLTPAMAYGITNLYPNIQALVTAFRQHGPGLLQDVKKSANKDGGVTEARLGPAISKRLFKVLLGTNPSSTDV